MRALQRRISNWLHTMLISRLLHAGFHHTGRIDW